jgi:PKD repeat protein
MQRSETARGGLPPKDEPTMSGSTTRQQLVSVLLPAAIIAIIGGNLLGLQWASSYGITLGYPVPQVHIDSPAIRSFVLHQSYQFVASASGRDLQYYWNFGDQGVSSGSIVTHTFQSNGNFAVMVNATDPAGHFSSDTINVTVLPPPPQASFTYAAGYYGYVNFDASSSLVDPSTSIARYQWSFGDGTMGTTIYPQASHYYSSAGTFQVTLVIVDNTGQQSSPFEAMIPIS